MFSLSYHHWVDEEYFSILRNGRLLWETLYLSIYRSSYQIHIYMYTKSDHFCREVVSECVPWLYDPGSPGGGPAELKEDDDDE